MLVKYLCNNAKLFKKFKLDKHIEESLYLEYNGYLYI